MMINSDSYSFFLFIVNYFRYIFDVTEIFWYLQ